MKRAYSPKDIAAKKWVTLPWGEKWNKPFGFPAENASWFISGASASGKSSFVMQLSKELCKYGLVLYLSYEEGVNQTFQRRMEYLKMNEVQGKFRVVVDETYEELIDRLKKPKSPKCKETRPSRKTSSLRGRFWLQRSCYPPSISAICFLLLQNCISYYQSL